MSRTYTFHGQIIPHLSQYCNLRTFKGVQKSEKNHYKIALSEITKHEEDPLIYGNKEELLEFQEENKDLLENKEIFEVKVTSPEKAELPIYMTHSILLKPQISDLDVKPPLPFEEPINYIKLPLLPIQKNNFDVETLSDEVLNYLGNFTFTGLKGKGKIIDIINHNTINLLVYVSLIDLSNKKNYKIGKNSITRSAIYSECKKEGFFTILKVKLCKESQNNELSKKVESLNHIVYYHFIGSTKYGRPIVKLYEDIEMQKSINSKVS